MDGGKTESSSDSERSSSDTKGGGVNCVAGNICEEGHSCKSFCMLQ